MRALVASTLLLAGCWGSNAYIVEGTVMEVTGSDELVIQHQEIPGYMPAMTMPFRVADPTMMEGVEPGDRVYARLMVLDQGSVLDKLRVSGHGIVPASYQKQGAAPVRPGTAIKSVQLPMADGSTWTLPDNQHRTIVTFLYTTCPLPEFCPATVARLQALQPEVPEARIVAVTIDPSHDTPEVLRTYATSVGAGENWGFARVEGEQLVDLARSASLAIDLTGQEIVHGTRFMVLDADGTLIERYDDNFWPLERVAEQLRTGKPPAPAGSDGTASPRPH